MARIVGVEIPNEKRVVIALTYIYGIGLTTSKEILAATNIDESKRVSKLSEEELKRLYEYIDKNVATEGNVKQKIFNDIKRLRDIRAYRGLRHKNKLPVRGQNTRKNAKTRKGKNKAIAITKKV